MHRHTGGVFDDLERDSHMANDQTVYLTADGLEKLKEELAYLTGTRRKEVAQMIEELQRWYGRCGRGHMPHEMAAGHAVGGKQTHEDDSRM